MDPSSIFKPQQIVQATFERELIPAQAGAYRRRSLRLKDYDYTKPGAYFVTICTQDHLCLFGTISDGKMVLNDAGLMISVDNLRTNCHSDNNP